MHKEAIKNWLHKNEETMGEYSHLSIFFFLPIFFSLLTLPSPLISIFNLYPRKNRPIQLKMTGQFCGFYLLSSFYWGLAPYLALGIIHILIGSLPVTAHGHFRCSPRALAINETCRNICHWQKSTENTGIHL